MTTFATYDHLPAPIREAFAELKDMLGDLDGKTIATAADGNTFIDEGTIVMDDAVKAFNTLVAALSLQDHGWRDISTAPTNGKPVDILAVYQDINGPKPAQRFPDARFVNGIWHDCWGNSIQWDEPEGTSSVAPRSRKPTHWMLPPAAPAMVAENQTSGAK